MHLGRIHLVVLADDVVTRAALAKLGVAVLKRTLAMRGFPHLGLLADLAVWVRRFVSGFVRSWVHDMRVRGFVWVRFGLPNGAKLGPKNLRFNKNVINA